MIVLAHFSHTVEYRTSGVISDRETSYNPTTACNKSLFDIWNLWPVKHIFYLVYYLKKWIYKGWQFLESKGFAVFVSLIYSLIISYNILLNLIQSILFPEAVFWKIGHKVSASMHEWVLLWRQFKCILKDNFNGTAWFVNQIIMTCLCILDL